MLVSFLIIASITRIAGAGLNRKRRRKAEATARRVRLLDGDLAEDILRGDAKSAADHLVQKSDLEAGGTATVAALRALQDRWYQRGLDRGTSLDLSIAKEISERTLPRTAQRNDRGKVLFELGNTLAALGESPGGTEQREQAADAYRAALTQYSQGQVPLLLALTHIGLGNALSDLGEREAGTARLEQAVEAYRAALTECRQDRMPLQWAMTQINLGNTLLALGRREAGTARLELAVDAYSAALTERRQVRVPLDGAMTQNNLGTALLTLGRREAGTARLEQAVEAYRAALTECRQDRVPLEWAATLGNEGLALLIPAERTSDPARARQALEQMTLAEATLRGGAHIPWAETFARRVPAAQALVDRLSGGPP